MHSIAEGCRAEQRGVEECRGFRIRFNDGACWILAVELLDVRGWHRAVQGGTGWHGVLAVELDVRVCGVR